MSSTAPAQTVVMVDQFHEEVKLAANKTFTGKIFNSMWSGLEWFLNWLRDALRNFFNDHLAKLPVVGKWSARIGTTIAEFIFSVMETCLSFLRIVLESPTLWKTMHEAAMKAWDENANRGLLVQTYAYGKKMASYFLEILMQCFERAIRAKKLNVTAEEKQEISSVLDDLLNGHAKTN